MLGWGKGLIMQAMPGCRAKQKCQYVNNIRLRKVAKRGRSWDGVFSNHPHYLRSGESGNTAILVGSVLPPG